MRKGLCVVKPVCVFWSVAMLLCYFVKGESFPFIYSSRKRKRVTKYTFQFLE